MPAPSTTEQFLELVRRSGLVEDKSLASYVERLRGDGPLPDGPRPLATRMLQDGLLTHFQAEQLLHGKARGFTLAGKYRLLEHLGTGGMGSVFLCEHISMRRRVAIKVLPVGRASDASYLERFYREARAVAALDHPNIVRAHDVDHDDKLHFLVMEYVDGSSLQDIVKRHGPLSVERTCHYLSQGAAGLQHAHEAGLVHRDIKPGNILVDRRGIVKVLDMGLARFFHEEDSISKKYDETVLGTADYLAPEQATDSNVDVRADIYSLGATLYFCLTGQTLFGEGAAHQKLIWQQTRQPKPIRSLRPEVPEELADIVEKRMLAKDPAQRFQAPYEILELLAPWTEQPIPPPPAEEMPRLCPAAARSGSDSATAAGPPSPAPRSGPRSNWTVTGGSGPHSPALPATRTRATAVQGRTPTPGGSSTATAKAAPTSGVGKDRGNGQLPVSTAVTQVPLRQEITDHPASCGPAPAKAPDSRLFLIIGAAVAAVLLLVGIAVGGGIWWLLSSRPTKGPAASAVVPHSNLVPQAAQGPGPAPRTNPPPATAPIVAEGVSVKKDDQGAYHVQAANYEATVADDGCMTSLRVGGTELLRPGLDISRGAYLHTQQKQTLKLPTIEQSGPNVLTAKGPEGSLRYEFGREALTCTATNASDQFMSFFLVFSKALTAALNDRGQWVRVPVKEEWPTVTWIADHARARVSGGSRVWPWTENAQVYATDVPAHQTRKVTLEVGPVTEEEVAQAGRVSGVYRVRKPAYEATVEGDGNLTSLRVGGTELLWVGGPISRGTYLYQDKGAGTVKMEKVERPSADLITAQGPMGSIRYEFGPDTLTYTVHNASPGPLNFFMVFTPAVKAVNNDQGEWAKTPAVRPWPRTTWFAGQARLHVEGGNDIWGPFDGPHQVWAAHLVAQETRKVVLKVGTATDAEAADLATLTGANPNLALQSPLDYEVFQRASRAQGVVRVRGKVKPDCDQVEARLSGKSAAGPLPEQWHPLKLGNDRAFEGELPAPAGGWYKLEVRALKGGQPVAQTAVDHVGVGEVFVISGQSNSTNCSQDKLKQQSGMVATFGGDQWRLADDPQLGVHDHTGGGSPWPAFGDALYEKYKVPIGIASTGHAGKSVNEWRPGSELYTFLLTRIKQLGKGGFRAVLWHQGESDVNMPSEEYAKKLGEIIAASKKDAGRDFPWFVAQVSYQNPYNPSFPLVRAGQKKLWDTGVALEGPDTDTLGGDNRDNNGAGIHFSAKGLRAHGKMWADKVGAYLDKVLAK
jgi:serine/threonine protein kinase